MTDDELTDEQRQELCPHPPTHLDFPTEDTAVCQDCGVTLPVVLEQAMGDVVNIGNGNNTEATTPQGGGVDADPEDDLSEYSQEELAAILEAIGTRFAREGFDLNKLYAGQEMITAAQHNSMAMLLIEKGIVTEEEANRAYFELMVKRMRQAQLEVLPQLIQHNLRESIKAADTGGLLGPDGNPINSQ